MTILDEKDKKIAKLKEALIVAAQALIIASDWHVENVQVYPPQEWNLPANGEDPKDGWCSTIELSYKLKEIATS